ncbi:hypothetical protein EPO33_02005 [Patescibacteria group bacterium]|nr:MAG: hypothetical protein EPO33_02005 [Patescibacteria group bacterium]
MNLYDYCRALARHADQRVGVAVCKDLVEEHAPVLNRVLNENEFRAAFHRMLQTFAPHEEVALISVPFSSRSMAQFLVVDVVTCGYRIPRDVWQQSPVLQSHLAAAMRHLTADLCSGAAPRNWERPATRAPKLTDQENACLQWGNITGDAAYIMALADRLRSLRTTADRQTVLEAIRDDIVDLPEVTLDDFARRLKTYAAVPAAKA